MKAAAFDYARPASLDEACAMLGQSEDARLIAGGQTLVPLMAMRLARPRQLIDIARLAELTFIRDEGDAVAIGAATRQCVVERDALVRVKLPLLARIMPYVGHAATRARGTIGGSLANADPAAELALVAVTLGATLSYRNGDTSADIAAADFFLGPMVTAVPPTGCVTGVRFPVWRAANDSRIGIGFHEISARQSDFAFASAAAQIEVDAADVCRRVVLAIGGVTAVSLRLAAVESALPTTSPPAGRMRERVGELVRDALDDTAVEWLADLHASAAFRRRVAVTLATRAVVDAWAEARGPHAR
ncbi:MAG: FAD binding domain-containing protein [Xanthobacteraceae bacterium]